MRKFIALTQGLAGGKYGSLKVYLRWPDTSQIKPGRRTRRAHCDCPYRCRKKMAQPELNEMNRSGCKRRPEGIDAHKEDLCSAIIADNGLDAGLCFDNPRVYAGVCWVAIWEVWKAFVNVDGETKRSRLFPPDELDRALAYKGELEEWAQKKYPCEGNTAGILMSAAQTAQML